jgi:hypothetical protein
MSIRTLSSILPMLILAACGAASQPAAKRPQAIAPPPQVRAVAGLDKVMGKDARALVSLFGTADQDVWEASARRLQFAGSACILDAYLYPPAKGKEPVVTHLDARMSDGRPAERGSCVSALSKGR